MGIIPSKIETLYFENGLVQQYEYVNNNDYNIPDNYDLRNILKEMKINIQKRVINKG